MFDAIIELGKRLSNIKESKILNSVFKDKTLQAQIIDLNQDQLQSGYDAEDKSTGNYSRASVLVYGKEPGPITLKDTGEFYNSMSVVAGSDSFGIKANTQKPGRDLLDRWPNAVGLTKENLIELMPEIKELTVEKLINEII